MNIPLQVYVSRHKRSYLVKFGYDIQLTDKIKSQAIRAWDSDLRGWVMPALPLMNIIGSYKGRKDIFFHLDAETKSKFLVEVEKAKIKEEEKVKHYFETMEKYKEWVAYKQVLEDTADELPIPGTIREGITPFPHQLVAAYLLDKVKCGLLSLEMGLGKSFSSIIYVEMQGNIDGKVIVITPNSLKYNYKYEVEKFTNSNAYVFRNLKTKKGKAEELAAIAEAKYVIFNYEYMAQAPKPKDKKKVKAGKNYFNAEEKFYSLGLTNIWGVICDESHRLKNQDSNTFINFEDTFGNAPTKVFLSGTPAPNRIEELYTIINMLSPEQFPNKSDYFTKYCALENYGVGWVPVAGKVPDYENLYKAMAPFTYRKRKIDVLKDLPEKTYSTIVIEPDAADLQAYFRVEEEIYEKLTPRQLDNPNLGLVVMLEFRRFLSTLKGKYLQPVFNRMLEENEKLIVFDFFKDSLNELHEIYKYTSVLHTGDVKDTQERAKMVTKFQEDENTRIFFGSNSTCGAGLTLTAANKLFLMTQPFSVGENDQLADRCHRIGQKNACTIYIPIINHTLDWAIFRMVENKRTGLVKAIDNEDYKSQVLRILYEQMKKNIDSRR